MTINGGMMMRAWYDISDAAIRREDASGVRQSQVIVEQLIAGELAKTCKIISNFISSKPVPNQ